MELCFANMPLDDGKEFSQFGVHYLGLFSQNRPLYDRRQVEGSISRTSVA
jgi:hypothetical protein